MSLRLIQPSDNPILAKLIKDIFVEYNAPKDGTVYSDPSTDHLYELFQAEEKSIFWVAENEENEVIGCCGIFPTEGLPENCAELVKFYISPKGRGKGFGKELMSQSILSAKQLGYSEIYIESLPEYSNAVRIYEKQGFEKLSQPLGNSGHTACNIWMLKKLD